MQCNYRAEITVLNAERFAGSEVGHVPERHVDFCGGRVPKRPTGYKYAGA